MTEPAVIMIGTGLAGYMTAKAFRQIDANTPLTLITADDGSFYSKPQLSTGLAHGKTADELAMFSAEQMSQQLSADIYTHCPVKAIDAAAKTVTLADDRVLSYSKLVLANGADVFHAPLAGDAVDQVLSINNLDDYRRFRQAIEGKKHVAILGAGLVGCEYANDLLKAGFNVSLIAPDEYPLQRFLPSAAAAPLQQALTDLGAQWHLQQFVTDVNQHGAQLRLTLCDQRGHIDADVVLSAVGFRPNEALARMAGVHCDKGVVVNRSFETSQVDVYAIGDCAVVDGQWLPFVAPINHGAKVLAQVLTGEHVQVSYPVMPIVTKTPCAPLCMVPATGEQLAWHCDGEHPDIVAQCTDSQGMLHGFALTGQAIRQRMDWVKKII